LWALVIDGFGTPHQRKTRSNVIMKITNQEHLFDIPPGVTYLNCAYLSPMLRAVAHAGKTGVDRKLRSRTISQRDFFNELDEARTLLARHAATDAGSVVAASSCAAAIAGLNLPLRKGEMVIVLGCEHFSNVYKGKLQCRETGAELVTIPATLLDALIAANVHISLREETQRVGLYLYNCATDIELLVDVLGRAIGKHQRD
jgi:selenocysteine lyase/cysteine desulfurase